LSHGGNAPSGIVWKGICDQIFLFKGMHTYLHHLYWKRHRILVFDSCVIVCKLIFNFQTLEIVGFANDTFDTNIPLAELGLCKYQVVGFKKQL
jgi:hypothetical protein